MTCPLARLLLAAAVAAVASAEPASAALTYNVYETGGNVVVQASGSLNLAGATPHLQATACGVSGALYSSLSLICTGPGTSPSVTYALSGPGSFSGTAAILGASSISGMITGIAGVINQFTIDSSYAGGPIAGSAIFNGRTLAGLGFTTLGPNATWTIGGTRESVNLVIGPPSPVGVPGPVPLLGVGAALGWSRHLRRRLRRPTSGTTAR